MDKLKYFALLIALSGAFLAGCSSENKTPASGEENSLSQKQIADRLPRMLESFAALARRQGEYHKQEFDFKTERANFKPIGQIGNYVLVHYRYPGIRVPGGNYVLFFDRQCRMVDLLNFTEFAVDIRLMHTILTAVDKSGYTERFQIHPSKIGKTKNKFSLFDKSPRFFPRKPGQYIIFPIRQLTPLPMNVYQSWSKQNFGEMFGIYVMVYSDSLTKEKARELFPPKPIGDRGIEYQYMHYSEFLKETQAYLAKIQRLFFEKPLKDMPKEDRPVHMDIAFKYYLRQLSIMTLVTETLKPADAEIRDPLMSELPALRKK